MKTSSRSITGYSYTVTKTPISSGVSRTEVVARFEGLNVITDRTNGDKKSPNPFEMSKVYSRAGYNNYSGISVAYGGFAYTNFYGPWLGSGYSSHTPVSSPDWNRTRDRAMEKIYDQLRGNSNLIVDFAEGGQTLKMLKSAANLKRVFLEFSRDVIKRKTYKKIPKGPSQGQRRLDYVTGKWLEYRYGWLPFVSSIYEAADTYRRRMESEFIWAKGRSGSFIEVPYTKISGTGSSSDPIRSREDLFFSWRTEYGMYFRIPIGTKISDWTSLNPASIAWELTPLSFVADWFLNVSQQLSLWENWVLFNKDFIGGYRTEGYLEDFNYRERGKTVVPFKYYPNGTPYAGSVDVVDAGFTKRTSWKQRTLVTSLPYPSTRLRLNVKLDAKRLLDSAALFHNLVAKKSRSF